jgi:hypothetical protein
MWIGQGTYIVVDKGVDASRLQNKVRSTCAFCRVGMRLTPTKPRVRFALVSSAQSGSWVWKQRGRLAGSGKAHVRVKRQRAMGRLLSTATGKGLHR